MDFPFEGWPVPEKKNFDLWSASAAERTSTRGRLLQNYVLPLFQAFENLGLDAV